MAPYDSADVQDAVDLSRSWGSKEVKTKSGGTKTVPVPPEPMNLAPGGYMGITVGDDQTLRLSPGVYYFHEEMNIGASRIELAGGGSDPVVVFVGKEAVFNGSRVNEGGNAARFQLCFCDEQKDPLELNAIVDEIKNKFEPPGGGGDSTTDGSAIRGGTTGGGATLEEKVRGIIAPGTNTPVTEDDEGTSVLRTNGAQITGSVSGKNFVTIANGGDLYGGIMGNVIIGNSTRIHQDLSLKGSNLMATGGWSLEGVHQLR